MDQVWWDAARAGGIVAWCLLAASVLWGLAISTRSTPPRLRPSWMLDLHRFLGGLAVVFVGVHLVGLLLDGYVHLGPVQLLVPLTSGWHPVAVAWGIVAMYLLVAVEVTSLLRRRMSRRAWRAVHALAFPTFLLGAVHALTAGTDRANDAWQLVQWLTIAAVVALTARRITQLAGRRPPPPVRTPTAPAPPASPTPWPPPARSPFPDGPRVSGPPVAVPAGRPR